MADEAGWDLQKSIYQVLITDTALTGVLGGSRIYEHVPHGTQYPYVSFGASVSRDWSTASDDGDEHVLTFHVWSDQPGQKEAQAIIAALKAALSGAMLTMTSHRLINLRYEFTDTRRGGDGEVYRGLVRYRAVTEPIV